MKKRNELGEYLNELGLIGVGVEIGVHKGKFSETILNDWYGSKLVLIDPWRSFSKSEYPDLFNVADEKHYNNMAETLQRVQKYTNRYKLMRLTSEEAVSHFPNEYLDFVYIDGNHTYDYIKKDLEIWYPKLKKNGLFAGHDYYNSFIFNKCGVKKAVNEFCENRGYTDKLLTTKDILKSWYFIK